MLFDDKYAQDYDIDFTGENTFITDSTDTLMTIAPAKLALLNANNHTILVTDPYLFPDFEPPYTHEEPQYERDLETLLKGTGASKIVFCSKEVKNSNMYKRMKRTLSQNGITLTHNNRLERCHDRFWYCPDTEKCICFGTSLNGIGKSICQINELYDTEIQKLKKYFIAA